MVVDSNVERVVARLHGIAEPAASAKQRIRELADALTPEAGAGDFAQAMMDLGATICRPRAPLCGACPLRSGCAASASGEPERFPGRKAKAQRPVRRGTAWWVEQEGQVWLVRRPAKGLLGGMAALPGSEWSTDAATEKATVLARVRHVFTHFALELDVVARDEPEGEGWWQPVDALESAGLPSLYRKAAAQVAARAT